MSEEKTFKRDKLKEIEIYAQRKWQEEAAFESNPSFTDGKPDAKFMITFPYPYMNGKLHLGHCFTLSKAEFAVGFEKLMGKNTLFPFGFHCTGMPIKACADKLKREVSLYGNPPVFPKEETEDAVENGVPKHSKLAAKSTGLKYQWEILRSLGIEESEIYKFADADYWIDYFPPLAINDLKSFGTKIDWRRSFVTTKINPYYDAFIRWQFNKLKSQNRIKFGKRHTIFSEKDNQPCMDHDRQSGEGVGPQEYTVIKLKVVSPLTGKLECLNGRDVFLAAATLRPETMYGQTNCWVGTEIKYGAFVVNDSEVFICTERAAKNMSHQGFSRVTGTVEKLAEFMGSDLLGLAVKAPLSHYEQVYVLPLMTVSANKGTGIVTSVPSDSPDDFTALRDLKDKPLFRQKFNILEQHVVPFSPIPVVKSELYGELSAVTVCNELNIKSQNDKAGLEKAKEMVYKDAFYKGVMAAGEWKGLSVQEAKPLIRSKLIESSEAIIYYEPEKLVISRSGDECVVSLVDQWYLDYGEASWKQDAVKCLKKMQCFSVEVEHQFEATLDWLNQWACSRSYGLGSALPWDPSVLIDSLSDSTVYMAYYTIAPYFHSQSLTGVGVEQSIKPEQMTDEVFDFIFCDSKKPETEIPSELLLKMKEQFEYFYPMDVRVSGKDLVPNHLTFMIYNHVSIFPEKYWPLGVRANGHLLLDGEKMSKSTGNFLTMQDACEKYTADATRIALADAGDSMEDANFVPQTATSAILRLHSQLEYFEEVLNNPDKFRVNSALTFNDKVFLNEIYLAINSSNEAYKLTNYRDALKYGFYELQNARDRYRDVCQAHGSSLMNYELLLKFIEVQTLILAPITPHFCEYVWSKLLKKSTGLMKARWPTGEAVDESILAARTYISESLRTFRQLLTAETNPRVRKGMPKATIVSPNCMTIYIAKEFPKWQTEVISVLKSHYDLNTAKFDSDDKIVMAMKEFNAKVGKKLMPFVMEIKKRVIEKGFKMFSRELLFDEKHVLEENLEYFCNTLGMKRIEIVVNEDENISAMPGEPFSKFYFEN